MILRTKIPGGMKVGEGAASPALISRLALHAVYLRKSVNGTEGLLFSLLKIYIRLLYKSISKIINLEDGERREQILATS